MSLEVLSISDTEESKLQAVNQEVNVTGNIEKKEEKIDLAINMNKWGFAFIFLFVALLAYILISGFTGIFPFERPDPLANEVQLKSTLGLTLMLIADLILLALGIFFGWIKTPPVSEEQAKKSAEEKPKKVIFTDEEVETLEEIEKEE